MPPPPPPSPEMTCDFLIQLIFCKKKTVWFIGVEGEQDRSAPPPKKNPGSAPGLGLNVVMMEHFSHSHHIIPVIPNIVIQ